MSFAYPSSLSPITVYNLSDSTNSVLSVLPPHLPSRSTSSTNNMETLIDSSSPADSSYIWPSSHRLLPASLINPIPFPNSHSLDSMHSIFHQPTAHNLPLLRTKPSRSIHHIPLSLINQTFFSNPISISISNRQHLYLGTKSSYPAPDPAPPVPYLLSNPKSPRLIHVSLVARHGTRNPTNNCLQRLSALQKWLTCSLSSHPMWLTTWSNVLDQYRQDPGSLTFEGEQELHGIGSRFAILYACHLQHVGSTVRLRSSHKARAVSSARSFLEGYLDACTKFNLPPPVTLLDSENGSQPSDSVPSECDPSDTEPSELDMSDIDADSTTTVFETSSESSTEDDFPVEILPIGHDAVLRYYERNAEYATFAIQHKALTRQDLSKGPLRGYAKEMASRFSKGLGASSSMDIDLIRPVSEACAFDFAHGRAATSMFCRVLTPKDTAVLELFEKQHRPCFNGQERFRGVAAPLVADLAESLRASVETPNNPAAHAADLRFAHAETLVPLLLLLGIRTNGLSPLHQECRQGLSAMSPFAANLAIELYEEGEESQDKRHFVRFRLHERYVECIPALGEQGATGVVELQHLLKFFDKILAEGMHHYT